MKNLNFDLEQLKRQKYASPESKMEWLFSALCFGKAKKTQNSASEKDLVGRPKKRR